MTTYRTENPATAQRLETFQTATDGELETVLADADAAFGRWRETGFDERAACLNAVADGLRRREDELAELMTTEMGKPISAARSEVQKCAWVCEHYAAYAESYLSPEPRPTAADKSLVRYEPLGPIFAIMPWNFPLWQVFRFAAPNIMAGNVGLLKHAPNVPQSAAAIAELFDEAGLPDGVFQNVYASTEQAASLIADDRVRGVTLTGSARAGAAVAETAGANLTKSVLELGGSDPLIALPDADVPRACEVGARSRLLNSGQSCIAAKRFILHEAVAGEFIERLQDEFEAATLGDPLDTDTDVGPMARADLRDELADQVAETVAAGGEILLGGDSPDREGYFYEPTILLNPPSGSPGAEEELFGPVATVFTVESVTEAIELANDTQYGLGAALWTDDIDRAERLVPQLEAGNVFVNELVKSDPRLPFGGVKNSGYGRELGPEGITEFLNRKTVYINR